MASLPRIGSSRSSLSSRFRIAALGSIVATLSAGPALAALGGPLESVEADRAHMRAAAAPALQMEGYTVHPMTLAGGGVVREYADKNGVVFALNWTAPGRPDLRQLLGEQHFADFQADNGVVRRVRTRRAMVTRRPDLVVHSGGRPGGFFGVAYIPSVVPPGFSAVDVQQ